MIVFDHEDGPVRSEAGFNQRRNNSRVGVARRVEQDKVRLARRAVREEAPERAAFHLRC